jgi:hypothetical protein
MPRQADSHAQGRTPVFDLLMLALLAVAFAAMAAFVRACDILTHRDTAGEEGRP